MQPADTHVVAADAHGTAPRGSLRPTPLSGTMSLVRAEDRVLALLALAPYFLAYGISCLLGVTAALLTAAGVAGAAGALLVVCGALAALLRLALDKALAAGAESHAALLLNSWPPRRQALFDALLVLQAVAAFTGAAASAAVRTPFEAARGEWGGGQQRQQQQQQQQQHMLMQQLQVLANQVQELRQQGNMRGGAPSFTFDLGNGGGNNGGNGSSGPVGLVIAMGAVTAALAVALAVLDVRVSFFLPPMHVHPHRGDSAKQEGGEEGAGLLARDA